MINYQLITTHIFVHTYIHTTTHLHTLTNTHSTQLYTLMPMQIYVHSYIQHVKVLHLHPPSLPLPTPSIHILYTHIYDKSCTHHNQAIIHNIEKEAKDYSVSTLNV